MHAMMLWVALSALPGGKEAPGSVPAPAQTVAESVESAESARPTAPSKSYGPAELKRGTIEALRRSGRLGDAEPAKIVPVLAVLYVEIGDCEAMPKAERRRLQSRLAIRMSEIRGDLIRQTLAQRAAQRQRLPRRIASTDSAAEGQNAGGGSGAIELIDLIQNTIAPESWQREGGRGSIDFYRPGNALVIRQTGEVHHQVGGLLEALRR